MRYAALIAILGMAILATALVVANKDVHQQPATKVVAGGEELVTSVAEQNNNGKFRVTGNTVIELP